MLASLEKNNMENRAYSYRIDKLKSNTMSAFFIKFFDKKKKEYNQY